MALFSSVLAPMAVGFIMDKVQGGSGIKGALGGAFGSMVGPAMSSGAAGGKGAIAGNTAANSLNAGNLLGQGGFQGLNALGMNSAVNAGLGGLTTSIPETAGGYSDLLGGDSMLQNYDMGMNGVESNLNYRPPSFGSVSGLTEGIDYPDFSAPPAQSNGYVPPLPTQNDLTTAANIKQYGGLEAPVPEESGMFDDGLLGYLGDFAPSQKDMGMLGIQAAAKALTPEEEEQLRHAQMQRANNPGNTFGQGGYQGVGGQYIRRAGS